MVDGDSDGGDDDDYDAVNNNYGYDDLPGGGSHIGLTLFACKLKTEKHCV